MAFNCKNQQETVDCGRHVIAYINNMGWVAQGLTDIINEQLLGLTVPAAGLAPIDITDDDCECDPICPATGVQPVGCLPTEASTVFNCVLWNDIKEVLINPSTTPATTPAYIPLLCQTLRCFLEQTPRIGFGVAAQIERFLCLAESLNTRLDSVSCNNNCPELVGDLFCLLLQILGRLFAAVTKASTLMYYNDCDINPINGNQIVQSFIQCIACDFINDLCELEKLIAEISALVVGFATCDMQNCTPCYTAPSVPKKVRPICPPAMMNPYGGAYGGAYGSGYPYQGKSCGCNCGSN